MDFYICGEKGLAAIRHATALGLSIDNLVVSQDSGINDLAHPQILKLAADLGLRVQTRDLTFKRSEDAIAIGWKWLIKSEYKRVFVIHDSLLPKYRGWNPLVTALQLGDTVIGATLFLADLEMDTGPIVDQVAITISHPTTIRDASEKIHDAIGALLLNFKGEVAIDPNDLVPQDETQASYSIWRDEHDYDIDWSRSAEELVRFIGSLSEPYDGARTSLQGAEVRVFKAQEVPDIAIVNRQPGKVWRITNDGPLVVCGSGLIQLNRIFIGQEEIKISRVRQRFI